MDAEERWPPAKGSAVKLHNSCLPAESFYLLKIFSLSCKVINFTCLVFILETD